MKSTWTVHDPGCNANYKCVTYHGAINFAKMLSKLTSKGVEITRGPVPYKEKHIIVVIQ